MSREEMDAAFALIRKYRNADGTYRHGYFGDDPEDEEFIQRAEQVLGHVLPEDYRRFVKKHVTGGLFGIEIYGVYRNKIGGPDFGGSGPGPNAVNMTLEAREKEDLEHNYLLIRDLGDGFEDYLDLYTGAVYRRHRFADDDDENEQWMAASFGAYLLEELEAAEEYRKEHGLL